MRAKKVDRNQNEIVKALRQIPGVSVADCSGLGKGFPDLVLGVRKTNGIKVNYLIEIKDGKKTASRIKKTESQEVFHSKWFGQIDVCKNLDEILKLIK